METAAQRPVSHTKLFAAGMAVFGASVLAATLMDGLPLYGALIVLGVLVFLSAAYPEHMLAAVVVISILVPVDLAVKAGQLPRIGPTRVLLGAFLIGLLLRGLSGRLSMPALKEIRLSKWIGLFIVAAIVSSIFSVAPFKSIYTLISLCFEQFLMFYIFFLFIPQPGFWNRFKNALFIATAAVCLLAFYEELSHNSFMLLVYPQEYQDFRGGILRVRSTFFHPIALACFLNIVYPYALADFIRRKVFLTRLLIGMLIVLIVVTLLLTVSRGPMIAFIIETSIMAVWWCRNDIMRKTALATATVLAVAVLVFAVANEDSLGRTLKPFFNPSSISIKRIDEGSSEYYRIALAKAVVSNMKGERLFYGNGPGTFFLAEVESSYAGHNHVLTAPDSAVFKLLFEYGGLGTTVFTLMLACILFNCIRGIRNARHFNDLTAYASTAAVVGFLWSNIFVSMFTLLPLAMLFWMSVAVVFNLAGHVPGQHGPGAGGTDATF